MARDFITRHPRFTYLMVGIALLVGVSLGQYKMYDVVSEERRTRISELSSKLTQKEATINTLTESHKRLQRQVKKVRIVSPDGTIKEVTESDTKSETDIRQRVQEEYKEKIEEEIAKVREEVTKVRKENKKLLISVGIDTELRRWLYGSYGLGWGFEVGGGVSLEKTPTFMVGVGFRF